MIFNVSASLKFFEFMCNMTSAIFTVVWPPLLPGTVFPHTVSYSLMYSVWQVPTLLLKHHCAVASSGSSLIPQSLPLPTQSSHNPLCIMSLMRCNPIVVIYKCLSPLLEL